MKGIILAGGLGTRLHPVTLGVSKQLLPIYDKPMIYYPLSVLMLSNIREILIITTPDHALAYQTLLGDGSQFGLDLSYVEQKKPDGLASAFILGEGFIGDDAVCLVLGDNIFYGPDLSKKLINAVWSATESKTATVFGYQVSNPESFGVVNFDANKKATSIEEKPNNPTSKFAVTGLYYYDNRVIDFAKDIKPSARGELEITSINNIYLTVGDLNVEILGRGYAWLDTGTHENLMQASKFIEGVETVQGFKIACLEEIAFSKGWINADDLAKRAALFSKTSYGIYLKELLS